MRVLICWIIIDVCLGSISSALDDNILSRFVRIDDLDLQIISANLGKDHLNKSRLKSDRSELIINTLFLLESRRDAILDRIDELQQQRDQSGYRFENLITRYDILYSYIKSIALNGNVQNVQRLGSKPSEAAPTPETWYDIILHGLNLSVTPQQAFSEFRGLLEEKLVDISSKYSIPKSTIFASLGSALASIKQSFIDPAALIDDSELLQAKTELRLNNIRIERLMRKVSRG